VGQTRVDLQHLLEDIRDAYPGAVEETILTEIVANALDSGAKTVRLQCDAAAGTLTVTDDGVGMTRRELARYHDVAASAKSRGEGIGFAGVGIKLGLLASDEVLTETRRGQAHVATSWRLASRHKAPWRWVPPPGLTLEHGTTVRLRLRNPLSPLVETGFVEGTLYRHFQTLLDSMFFDLLARHYPAGIRFFVNAREIACVPHDPVRARISIRLRRGRKASAEGYLVRSPGPLPEEQRGVTVSTLGKVIKRGWDWLGLAPTLSDRVTGLVEVPSLAQSLTLNKADFIRVGTGGAFYLAYRKAIQEAVSAQLGAWGEGQNPPREESRRRKTRPLERDLATILLEMAEDFPLIASLVDRKRGGQKRLSMAPSARQMPGGIASGLAKSEPPEGPGVNPPSDEGSSDAGAALIEPGQESDETQLPAETTGGDRASPGEGLLVPASRGRRVPARLGLRIQFESRDDDPGLARLIESTVWINEAHAAYQRAVASRAEGYHVAVAVAMTLATLAVAPAETHAFITAFLAHWGEAVRTRGPRPKKGRDNRRSGGNRTDSRGLPAL